MERSMGRVISFTPARALPPARRAAPAIRGPDDPLGAARGILLGCVLGLALWVPVGLLLWWLVTL